MEAQSTEQFEIEMCNGIAVLKLAGQSVPADIDTFQRVMSGLKQGYEIHRQAIIEPILQDLVRKSEWVFPATRRDVFSSGRCIYFIHISTRPGQTKIGYTDNLAKRSKSLANEYKGDVTVQAFARTQEHKKFEKLLHAYLLEHRIEDEWFVRDQASILLFNIKLLIGGHS